VDRLAAGPILELCGHESGWYENGGGNMLPRPGFPRSSNYFSIWLRPVQTAKGLKGQYPELKDIEIGHAHFAIRMALREMSQMITTGMNKEDFELTRTFLRSYMGLGPIHCSVDE
jgi:zinc protease